jgi:hypothetical protein
VITTRPDTYEIVERDLETVLFVFDERISERPTRGTLDDAVLVSPRTGEVDVDHGRDGLEVFLAGGFEEGRVYRVTLLPVISDLFGNTLRDPFELVFSTGPELVPSAVAGLAWDRVTGRGIEGLVVLAVDPRDSTVYQARTDTAGIYAFRYLPPGPYQVTAFQDRNADEAVDPMEPQGERLVQVTGADTLVAEIGVLQPDTTPSVVTAVEALGPRTVTLRFDDPVDPLWDPAPGNVGLDRVLQDDSAEIVRDDEGEVQVDEDAPAPAVVEVLHPWEYAAWAWRARDSLAALDSLDRARARELREAGDTARADSLVATTPRPRPPAIPGTGAGRGRPTGGGAGAEGEEGPPQPERGPDGRPLPSQRLVVRLDGELVQNRAYQVTATGVRNVAGIPLGGGTGVVVRQPPPAPDTAADTLAADTTIAEPGADEGAPGATAPAAEPRPDTIPDEPPDTAAPSPDTAAPSSDTAAPSPDTVGPPPDTVSPPPDTSRVGSARPERGSAAVGGTGGAPPSLPGAGPPTAEFADPTPAARPSTVGAASPPRGPVR